MLVPCYVQVGDCRLILVSEAVDAQGNRMAYVSQATKVCCFLGCRLVLAGGACFPRACFPVKNSLGATETPPVYRLVKRMHADELVRALQEFLLRHYK